MEIEMPLIKVKSCLNCGIDHEWLFSGATLKELRVIKQMTGMNQSDFQAAGDEGDPESLAALLYILHARDKIKIPFDDIDLDFEGFSLEPTEEEKEALEKLEREMKAAVDAAQNPKAESGPEKKAASKRKS